MKRGPKPKPTKLKLLQGNPGKRPLNKNEPQPKDSPPVCPSFLTRNAKSEFKRLCSELRAMGLLHSADRAIIAVLAESWADWRLCRELIRSEGRYYQKIGKDGCMIEAPFPWIRLERDVKQSILKFSAELGLTPSARSRLTVPQGDVADEMERYLTPVN